MPNLVLHRHQGQRVVLDLQYLAEIAHSNPDYLITILMQPIVITVVDVRSDVRLGFEAHPYVKIDREEVREAKQATQ